MAKGTYIIDAGTLGDLISAADNWAEELENHIIPETLDEHSDEIPGYENDLSATSASLKAARLAMQTQDGIDNNHNIR